MTLIEMLTGLLITSVIVLIAVPSFDRMISRTKTISGINRLVGAVNFTRHTAVQFRTMTTLCALKPNGRCGADWAGTLTVFLDRNQNAKLEADERIIRHVEPVSDGIRVRWRAFQNKPYLQMTPWGYTNFQNGNFVVCESSTLATHPRQLVVNIQGRTRLNRRVNDAGQPIDRRGKALRC